MTSAPRSRPEFLVIEGGRGQAADLRETSSTPPAPVAPSAKVVDHPQVEARAELESPPPETRISWREGMAAAGVFLASLSLWVFGIVWTGDLLMQP